MSEVVSSRMESHFRGDLDARRLRPGDLLEPRLDYARVFESEPLDPQPDRNFDTHALGERHFTEVDRNYPETHAQVDRHFAQSLALASRGFEPTSSQLEIRTYETLTEPDGELTDRSFQSERHFDSQSKERNFESDPGLSRNFEAHSGENRNFESHLESRNFESQRDRTSLPLDCSTSLNAIDHRLEGEAWFIPWFIP